MKVLWAPWRMEYILGEDKTPGCIFCPEPGEDLAERLVLYKHALRNAFIPILTLIGIYIIVMVGDSITIEIVFSRPGFGRLIQGGISQRDYTILQSILMLYVAFAAGVNLVLDLLYGVLDPRIRYTGREV